MFLIGYPETIGFGGAGHWPRLPWLDACSLAVAVATVQAILRLVSIQG
jgi:hypothetical protein